MGRYPIGQHISFYVAAERVLDEVTSPHAAAVENTALIVFHTRDMN
jgi:hypothetical protein